MLTFDTSRLSWHKKKTSFAALGNKIQSAFTTQYLNWNPMSYPARDAYQNVSLNVSRWSAKEVPNSAERSEARFICEQGTFKRQLCPTLTTSLTGTSTVTTMLYLILMSRFCQICIQFKLASLRDF